MAAYAYLRVSTDQQDVDNQSYGVLVYANARGLGPLQFVADTASGRLAWRERAVGRLLTETTQAGDVVLFAEVSRMARSTLQVLEMLACCMQRGVHVHIAKQQMVLDGSLPSGITATVLGLAAEIEREFIAMRTREALAKWRADGKPLGPPKGKPAARLKLDAQEAVIRGYLAALGVAVEGHRRGGLSRPAYATHAVMAAPIAAALRARVRAAAADRCGYGRTSQV